MGAGRKQKIWATVGLAAVLLVAGLLWYVGKTRDTTPAASGGMEQVKSDQAKGEEDMSLAKKLSQLPSGAGIELDPVYPYYLNRSEESIADEIQLAGYKTVHYVVVDEYNIRTKLIEAFHQRGIQVWARIFGNGAYTTASFPPEWTSWQTELVKPLNDGFARLSMHSKPYTEWKKKALAEMMKANPFDGVEIMEPFFPEWGGLESGVYGDVGPIAQAAFREKYGLDIPDFSDPQSPKYYNNDKATYEKWVNFRVEAVNDFLNELVNGKGGIREAKPSIGIGIWSLGIDAGPDSVAKLREVQGLDAPSMIAKVKPDIFYLQTHWPDWLKPDLQPNYAEAYEPFIRQVRESDPDMPIGIEADLGSDEAARRGNGWFREFGESVTKLGFRTWTGYEYHIGKYMYEEAPIPVKAVRDNEGQVTVSFQHRVDEASAKAPGNYAIMNGGTAKKLNLDITVDGNRVVLKSEQFPKESFRLRVEGVANTPELLIFKGYDALTTPAGTVIEIK